MPPTSSNVGLSGTLTLGKNDEAHFPALRGPSQTHTRVPRPHAHSRRQGGDSCTACERAGTPRRLRRAERYRRAQRLGSDAVAKVLASARPRRAGSVSVQVRPNGLAYPRLGLVVPKRLLRRAVDRNRTKRIFREWFRRNQGCLGGQDMLLRLGARPRELGLVIADVEHLFAAER
jgi:ribonuclease P protein component